MHYREPLNDVSVSVWNKECVCFKFGVSERTTAAAGHLPTSIESALGDTEDSQVCEAVLDLADPSPAKKEEPVASTPTILQQNVPKLEGMP